MHRADDNNDNRIRSTELYYLWAIIIQAENRDIFYRTLTDIREYGNCEIIINRLYGIEENNQKYTFRVVLSERELLVLKLAVPVDKYHKIREYKILENSQ